MAVRKTPCQRARYEDRIPLAVIIERLKGVVKERPPEYADSTKKAGCRMVRQPAYPESRVSLRTEHC